MPIKTKAYHTSMTMPHDTPGQIDDSLGDNLLVGNMPDPSAQTRCQHAITEQLQPIHLEFPILEELAVVMGLPLRKVIQMNRMIVASNVVRFGDMMELPSERLVSTVGRDNTWRRAMEPALRKVKLEWATFQVLRRTNARLSRKAKVDDKVAADQRGHGLGVSLEVYSMSDLEQEIEAIKRLESEVIQQSKGSR